MAKLIEGYTGTEPVLNWWDFLGGGVTPGELIQQRQQQGGGTWGDFLKSQQPGGLQVATTPQGYQGGTPLTYGEPGTPTTPFTAGQPGTQTTPFTAGQPGTPTMPFTEESLPELGAAAQKYYFEDLIPGWQQAGYSNEQIQQIIQQLQGYPDQFGWRQQPEAPAGGIPEGGVGAGGTPSTSEEDLLNALLGGGEEAQATGPQTVTQGGYTFYYDPITQEWKLAGQERVSPEQETQQRLIQQWGEQPSRYYIPLTWAATGKAPTTPEAVAALQGVQPGGELEQLPMATPSLQFWNSLVPEEQQQILGTADWLGISPETFMNIYQRMIPGTADRMGLRWSR